MPVARALEDHLRDLLGGLAPGDALAPGVVLREISSERGPRLSFAVGDATVHVEVARRSPGRRYALATGRLALSYRVEPDASRALGFDVCRAVAELAARHEDAVLAALARDAAVDDPATRVREVRAHHLLERAGGPGERHFTVTPYVGCLIGCRFCYAAARVDETRALLGLPQVAWGSYVDVRVDAPEVLARELPGAPPLPVKFCAIVSDPYHAIERRYALTRRMLLALAAAAPRPVLLLTRSALLLRDLEVLAALPRAWVGVSLPTVDDDARAHFEPRAAAVAERLDLLARCRDAGVRTFAVVQPILPGSIDALAEALASRVSSARIDVLHGVEGAARDFDDPRWACAADPAWQASRAAALRDALQRRGVAVRPGELPPELLPSDA